MNFLEELKRRHVFRVAAAYAVVAWLALQVVDLAAESFGAPDWVMRMLIVALGLGLPVAVFLAWAFEITPQGVKRMAEVDASPSLVPSTGRRLNRLIIGGLVIALGYFVWESRFAGASAAPEAATTTVEAAPPSIAVLPFANMSSDPEQEYFSDGITEEILNALAKIRELRVAARTSAFQYKGQNPDLREVGRDLGVQHILEGSVRRQGEAVRITAQLIETETGFHLWTDQYDRDLDDIFAVQEEISTSIAEALSVELNLTETPVVASRTDNRRAYDLYLQSLALWRARTRIDEAIDSLKVAVELDPDFAPAWATLARALDQYGIWASQEGLEVTRAERDSINAEVRVAAETAHRLAPDLPAALHAMGKASRDGREVMRYYRRALDIDPSNSLVMEDMVGTLFAYGLNAQAVELAERMVALDPMPVNILAYAMALTGAGDYPAAIREFERAATLDPGFGPVLWFGADALVLAGDVEGYTRYAARFAATVPERAAAHMENARTLTAHLAEHGEFTRGLVDALEVDRHTLIVAADVGAADRAVELLAARVDSGDVSAFDLPWVFDDPRFAPVRRSPEFHDWMRAGGFVEFWQEFGYPSSCRPVGENDFNCS
ncbi:MAG: hypothetical protein ABFS34_02500 [Gemmatimonadota bacterium]